MKTVTRIGLFLIIINLIASYLYPSIFSKVYASGVDVNILVTKANEERTRLGLQPLKVDSRLVKAAQDKAADMFKKDYWNHFGPNGETPWMFIEQEGYSYSYAGENLARNFNTSIPIHDAWMDSPTHRANIVSPDFEDIGIVAVEGELQGVNTILVVQMFGREANTYNSSKYKIDDSNNNETEKDLEITSPTDGEITKDAAFTVKGNAKKASDVQLFHNSIYISQNQVVNGNFNIRPDQKLKEGENELYVAGISKSGDAEGKSDTIRVVLDTLDPVIHKDTFKFLKVTPNKSKITYEFEIKVEDGKEVFDTYNDVTTYFSSGSKQDYWNGTFIISDKSISFKDLKISTYDDAGNYAEIVIPADQLTQSLNVAGLSSTTYSDPGLISDLGDRVSNMTLQQKLNIFFALIIFIAVLFDSFVMMKTNIVGNTAKMHFAIPLFVGVFLLLIGGVGQIN